jgi:aspartate aminotransferase
MISERIKNINPSATLAIAAKAKLQSRKKGIDVLSLSAGEPDFDTPEHIKNAAIGAINEGFTKYTTTSGIPELKDAICAKFKTDNVLSYAPENILVSNGAKQALYNIIQTLINPFDEVLIPVPYWVSYMEMVRLADGICIFLPCGEQLKITADLIEKHATSKTKLLIINSPSNPTGMVYSKKELEDIASVCLERKIFVISDEIYEKLIYDSSHFSIAQVSRVMKKQTAVVNGVSKAYAMTGWRIGYVACEKEIISAATKLQDHTTSGANSIAQKAAFAAITGPQTCVEEMRREYKKRRDYVIERLSAIKGISVQKPDGAFYVFPDISQIMKKKKISGSALFCDQLLTRENVALIPGSAFGNDNYIRLSFAASFSTIKEALDRLERFIIS